MSSLITWCTCKAVNPAIDSSDYDKYIEELQSIKSEVGFYKGFYQPPTEEEYIRLYDEYSIDG